MKYVLCGVLASLSLLAGCASAPKPASTLNVDSFRRLLRAGRYGDAARFEILFRDASDPPTALLAQYYLSTCQPRSAARAIERLPRGKQRELFTDTLAALTTIERPKTPPPPHAPAETGPVQIEPLDDEIWSDEWPELAVNFDACQGMPLIEDKLTRARYRSQARVGFGMLSEADYERDWGLVVLALDLGLLPPNGQELLQHYASLKSDPYYQRLQAKLQGTHSAPLRAKRDGTEISLSEFQVVKWSEEAHALPTPWLADEGTVR